MNNELEVLAKRRVQARTGLLIHVLIYLVMNTGFALIWYVSGHGYPWFLWPMFGWGIGIVGHAVTMLIGPDSPHERRAIDRELRRMRAAS